MISPTSQQASPKRVLTVNRGHWSIESVHYIIDWNYDEDRSQIPTGFSPENITRLPRFAVGILKSFQKRRQSIAEMMRKLAFNSRLVFDYLRMTSKFNPVTCPLRTNLPWLSVSTLRKLPAVLPPCYPQQKGPHC